MGIGHAGGVYLHHHLTLLARRFDVRLLAPDVVENRHALAENKSPVYDICLVPRPPWRRVLDVPFGTSRRVLGTLSAGYWPIWLDGNARRRIAEADIIEVQWSAYLPLVRTLRRLNPHAVIGAVEHEVETMRRRRLFDAAHGAVSRLRAALSMRLVESRESRFLRDCDVVVAFKADDLTFVTDLGAPVRQVLTEPYVEPPDPMPAMPEGPHVLFVGAMDRSENDDGIRWLLDNVWSAVLKNVPAATITVAGAHPPSWLRERESPSLRVVGYVDDLANRYADARVVVAPIRLGGGIKFKIAEALAAGRPVVALAETAEGYRDVPAACLRVCESADQFAAELVRVLTDDKAARLGSVSARRWVLERLDFDRAIEKVAATYVSAADERTAISDMAST